jgi:hypothetical protein
VMAIGGTIAAHARAKWGVRRCANRSVPTTAASRDYGEPSLNSVWTGNVALIWTD